MITQHWLNGYEQKTFRLVQLAANKERDQIIRPACFVNVLPFFLAIVQRSIDVFNVSYIIK